MRRYKHKTLGVIIEVESEIGGDWVELIPAEEPKEEPKEEKPKRRPKRKG